MLIEACWFAALLALLFFVALLYLIPVAFVGGIVWLAYKVIFG